MNAGGFLVPESNVIVFPAYRFLDGVGYLLLALEILITVFIGYEFVAREIAEV